MFTVGTFCAWRPEYWARKLATACASSPRTMFSGMIAPEKPPLRIAYSTCSTFSLRKLKFGPFVRTRFLMLVAEPSAPTTDSVWQPEQWSQEQHRAAVVGAGLGDLDFLRAARAEHRGAEQQDVVVAASFMRGEYIGPTQNPWAVPAARNARHDHHERRQRHHAHLAAHDLRDERLLLGLGQPADRLGAVQAALVEDRLRRADAQLLGDERHRERQQRVQVEEVFARVRVRRAASSSDRHRERQRRALADPQQHPERAERLLRSVGSPRYHSQPPSSRRDRIERRHGERAGHDGFGHAARYRADCHYVTLCHKR